MFGMKRLLLVITGVMFLTLASTAYGAGFGIVFAGGGVEKKLKVNEEETINIKNEEGAAMELLLYSETFFNKGSEYVEFKIGAKNCEIMIYANNEVCPVKAKVIKAVPAGAKPEAVLTIKGLLCPNMSVTVKAEP